MADKEKIGFVAPHRYRALEDGTCEYCDGTKREHVELFPDKNPLARIEYSQPHRFIRRKDSEGGCDYCGETHSEHLKYFPEHNPDKDRGLDYLGERAGFASCFVKPEV